MTSSSIINNGVPLLYRERRRGGGEREGGEGREGGRREERGEREGKKEGGKKHINYCSVMFKLIHDKRSNQAHTHTHTHQRCLHSSQHYLNETTIERGIQDPLLMALYLETE